MKPEPNDSYKSKDSNNLYFNLKTISRDSSWAYTPHKIILKISPLMLAEQINAAKGKRQLKRCTVQFSGIMYTATSKYYCI